MKKINIRKVSWKLKKKISFTIFFMIVSVVVIMVTIGASSLLSDLLNNIFGEKIVIPNIVMNLIFGIVIGIALTYVISIVLLYPIKKLKNMMNEVANGDLTIRAKETSSIDEIEDIYHYFNVMMEELRATEIIQSDFISNVSHEFKTPLNAIDGYTTLLSSPDLTNEEKEQYLQKIHYNVNRMNELIGNILLLSKLDNISINSNNCLYRLDEQIRNSIVFLEPKWEQKKINFDIELEEINYYGNESLLIHVWNNLIDNAIKFGPCNGNIVIKLYKENKNIIFTIQDDGPGISDEVQKFVFNKFYQVDTSHKSDGNGLGLALVKKILDISNGNIKIENNEEKGCKFIVTLRGEY